MIAAIGLGVAAQIGQTIARRMAATDPKPDPGAAETGGTRAASHQPRADTASGAGKDRPDAATSRLVAEMGRMLLDAQSSASATASGTAAH